MHWSTSSWYISLLRVRGVKLLPTNRRPLSSTKLLIYGNSTSFEFTQQHNPQGYTIVWPQVSPSYQESDYCVKDIFDVLSATKIPLLHSPQSTRQMPEVFNHTENVRLLNLV